ncbi:MAG: hypothetical protein MUC73_09640 [Cyclobacteriaceae bacterium]|jgi:uncharacterized membrane protein YfcA|nr:hypothetical protein [Cyclobacteriaceae bacterium]
MEELDDLKSIWKQQKPFEAKNEEEIALMLKGRSKDLITKLKRNVWFELILTMVCIAGLGFYGFTLRPGALMWTILALLVFLVSYSFYYVKKIILLNEYDSSATDLKSNLQQLIERLEIYLKFYKRSYAILYPVFFALGILFGALETGFDQYIQKFKSPTYVMAFLLLTIVFMVGIYTITNWYLKKLYGNYIDKLKSLLKELQN